MNKIRAFIGLELRCLKPYVVSILVMLLLAVGMGVAFHSAGMASSYLMMMLILIVSYPFSIGERNRLDILYATLSIKRSTVVSGRYGFAVVMEIGCIGIALVVSWLLSFFLDAAFDLQETLLMLCMLSGVFSLIASVQFPLYFKLGYSKARMLALLPFFILFIALFQIPTIAEWAGYSFSWESFSLPTAGASAIWYMGPVLAGLVLLWGSSLLSSRIYKARDL